MWMPRCPRRRLCPETTEGRPLRCHTNLLCCWGGGGSSPKPIPTPSNKYNISIKGQQHTLLHPKIGNVSKHGNTSRKYSIILTLMNVWFQLKYASQMRPTFCIRRTPAISCYNKRSTWASTALQILTIAIVHHTVCPDTLIKRGNTLDPYSSTGLISDKVRYK